jgi:predicted transcriptional regulator YdeE
MENIKLPALKLVGLKLDNKTTNEKGQSAIDCGELWNKFENEKVIMQIPGKLNNDIYAVYYDYDGDHTKPFSYFIGTRVKENVQIPEGMTSLNIPEQNYTKVTSKGKLPDCIANYWIDIWNTAIDRSYSFDFEVYDERSKDWNNGEVDIFVSTRE